MRFIFKVIIFLLFTNLAYSQLIIDDEMDKCGIELSTLKAFHQLQEDNWGYGFDSLINNIAIWELSDYVEVISIGQSVQEREIYELIITDNTIANTNKHRIYIHARTHPNEVQSFWVTKEIIESLISDSPLGNYLRGECIFHIVPMYNPDGVELELSRQNANKVDIESNWNSETPEIEVMNLRKRFSELMDEENPIEIALNMHSAYACKRYFVYHHENGTSPTFTQLEEQFIESIRGHFYDGIQPFTYFTSWKNGTPGQYPESWWWTNYQEQVMALTYEDMNCSTAGFYDKTAYAILRGISDYLGFGFVGIDGSNISSLNTKAYPNPFKTRLFIEWNNYLPADRLVITNVLGKQVLILTKLESFMGSIIWDGKDDAGNDVSTGIYLIHLFVNNQVKSIKVVKQ